MRVLRPVVGIVLLLMLVGGATAAAIPGPQRALCPQCFGLVDIGDGIFTDDPAQATQLRQLVVAADAEMATFFGAPLHSHPRYVLCTTSQCLASFGGGPTGVSYGWQLIRISPQGLRSAIVTHERLHAELAARMGWGIIWHDRVPVWFNEGLAVYLAGDDRFDQAYSGADIAWIKAGIGREQWDRLLHERDWIAGYGAARAAVADLDARIGRDGLRRLVEMLAAGEGFDAALAQLLAT